MADIAITDITAGTVGGAGAFDKLMAAVTAHLEVEYNASRIKGSDYATVYLGSLQSAMAQSMAFVLGEQQADKQADAIAADIIRQDAESAKKVILLTEQHESEAKQNVTDGILDKQLADIISTTAVRDAQSTQDILNKAEQVLVLTAQKLKINEEATLIEQKTATEEAQTLETTTVGTNPGAVTGVVAKQKALITNQTEGFIRDAEQKALKIMMDSYAVRRSTDSTEVPPTKADSTDLNAFIQKAADGIGVTGLT